MMKYVKILSLLTLALVIASCNQDPHAQAQRYVNNGNKFFEKGKYKEASIMYRRALQKDLKFGEAYYRLGLTEVNLRSFGDAVKAFRRAVELQPTNADATTKLAEIYLIASIQDPQHSKDLLVECRELVVKLLQQDPNSYNGHRLLGQIALVEMDFDKAVAELETAYKIQSKPELAASLFQALVADKRAPDAEKLADDVIAKNKTFATMYDLLYTQYMRTNRQDQAETVLKLKVANNAMDTNALMQLAAYYFYEKRVPDMDAVIKQVTDEKRFPDGHLLAGDFFLFRVHDFEQAREQYEAGEKSQPKDKVAYQKRLVELMASNGQSQDAGRLLETILAANPKDENAIAMRAALNCKPAMPIRSSGPPSICSRWLRKIRTITCCALTWRGPFWRRAISRQDACNWKRPSRRGRISWWLASCWRKFT